jgi:DNA-binding PucR family transcriptional regulator
VERVLAQIPQTEVINDYLGSTIGALENRPEFITTLETYLEHGGNKVATAAALPMHRSSLVYRLGKISEMLGDLDLDDPERRFELWLALRLRRMVGLRSGSLRS